MHRSFPRATNASVGTLSAALVVMLGWPGGISSSFQAPARTASLVDDTSARPEQPVEDARPAEREEAGSPGELQSSDQANGGECSPTHLVDREPTPLGELQLAIVLREGHRLVFGIQPSDTRLAGAWAHLALEHARGRGIDCNNLGNLSLGKDYVGPHFARWLDERKRKGTGKFGPWRRVEMKFRAYPTALDGARAYWSFMAEHYASVVGYFTEGQPLRAARRLTDRGYSTGPSDPYEASIASLYAEFYARVWPELVKHHGAGVTPAR